MSAVDEPCGRCGCAKGCHKRGMRWGQTVYGQCRHHLHCPEHLPPGTEIEPGAEREPAPNGPEVLESYPSWACERCGSRYGRNYRDHPCGPLTPVIVTITRREVDE